jgi:hypothetical protein
MLPVRRFNQECLLISDVLQEAPIKLYKQKNTTAINLAFLDQSRYFSFK